MWRELAGAHEGVELREPATPSDIEAIATGLGQSVPDDLRALLQETDGIQDAMGCVLIWPSVRILQENQAFRTTSEFQKLYMPFTLLMFFGDNSGGDQFGFVRTPERNDVFWWDHETDSRQWIAPNLETYLRRMFEADGEDWYRANTPE
jgi:hypothetical protein